MKRLVALISSVLLVALAGPSGALTTDNQVLASKSALNQATPTIVGTVTGTTDYSVTVQTRSGESVTFIVDSRTVVPASLGDGIEVRIEFHAMENGSYHARRITPLRPDEIRAMESRMEGRERASNTGYGSESEPVHGSSEAAATPSTERYSGTSGSTEPYSSTGGSTTEGSSGTAGSSTPEPQASATSGSATEGSEPASGGTAGETGTERHGDLPGTASALPLVGLVGVLALAAATGLWLARRRRA